MKKSDILKMNRSIETFISNNKGEVIRRNEGRTELNLLTPAGILNVFISDEKSAVASIFCRFLPSIER